MLSRLFIGILCFSCMKIAVQSVFCDGNIAFTQDNVPIGGTTELVFTPTRPIDSPARKWLLKRPGSTVHAVYNTQRHTHLANYVEIQPQVAYGRTLRISNVSYDVIGDYMLRILDGSGNVVCDTRFATLTVKPMPLIECGTLSVLKSSIGAGEHASFTLNGNDVSSKQFVWQRDVGNGYETIPNEVRFDTRSVQDTKAFLFISEATVSDSGEYRVKCQNKNSNTARLEVVPTIPSKPVFKNVKTIYTCVNCIAAYKDKEMTISCSSENGSNPISLAMYKDGHPVGETRTEPNRKLIAEYKFTPTYSDIKTKLTCAVKNDALAVPLTTDIQLYLYIVPEKVKVEVPNIIKEGEEQSIVCSTFKGRPPVKPDFLFNFNQLNTSMTRVVTATGDTYTVKATIRKTFTRHDNQASVACGLLKKHFNSDIDEKDVNVLFPPLNAKLIETDKTNHPNGDTKLELKLAVGPSNPLSQVKWQGLDNVKARYTNHLLNDSDTKGQSLIVDISMDLTRADNNREIKAIITNKMFPDIDLPATFMISIKYAPVIKLGKEVDTKVVFVGDDVVLTCNVDSNPLSTIAWHNETGLVKEAHGAESLDLYLVNVTTEVDQTLTCVAVNEQGTANKSLLIVVKERTMKLSESSTSVAGPVAGVLVVLAVAVIVGGLVFILIRKRRTESENGSNTLQIKIEDRKPSARPSINEPVYSNMVSTDKNAGNEQVLYASVTPKNERVGATVDDKEVKERSGYRNDDGLLYADLELHHGTLPRPNQPVIQTEESTQYVTVDFSKTGTLEIRDVPDDDGESE